MASKVAQLFSFGAVDVKVDEFGAEGRVSIGVEIGIIGERRVANNHCVERGDYAASDRNGLANIEGRSTDSF